MRYSSFKSKDCSLCGSPYHTKMTCRFAVGKPMKFESDKAKAKRLETREKWFEANPPDKFGYWECYISKHPACPKKMRKGNLLLEHNLSKARRPDLIYDVTNIYPACRWDNKAKGSLSAEEYMSA